MEAPRLTDVLERLAFAGFDVALYYKPFLRWQCTLQRDEGTSWSRIEAESNQGFLDAVLEAVADGGLAFALEGGAP